MGSYSTSEFQAALVKKGFIESDTHHHMYRLHIDGKKTNVQTKTSHNEKEYDDNMLRQRRQQIGLQNKKQFIAFIECPMEYEDYKKIVIQTGIVKLSNPHSS